METRLSRFGVGPRIVASTLACALPAAAATFLAPGVCLIPALPLPIARAAGALFIATGFLVWISGVVTVMRAYGRDQLVTGGIFSLCRHPVYSVWLIFFLPGVAILARSWPLLLAPLVGYAVFRKLIHVEDDYLAKRFGPAYLAYRARVNELVPIPRF
jgi:protein-S-isoprenylcysteine O-methyltransferase Ste14